MRLGSNPAAPSPAGPANGSNGSPNVPPNGPPDRSCGGSPNSRFPREGCVFDPFWIRLAIRFGSVWGSVANPFWGPAEAGAKRIPKQIPKRIQNGSKMHSPMHVKRIIRLLHNNPVLAEPDFHNPKVSHEKQSFHSARRSLP